MIAWWAALVILCTTPDACGARYPVGLAPGNGGGLASGSIVAPAVVGFREPARHDGVGGAGPGHRGPGRHPGPDGAPDRWLAEDKLRHFAASFSATAMAYGAARTAVGRGPARIAAAAAGLALGFAKEEVDRRHGGPFSLKDLAWDAAGVALGFTLSRSTR